MRTLFVTDPPPMVEDWLARRRALGAGLTGATPCNIGTPTDFRVPDHAYFRHPEDLIWNPTAAIVVEVVSPGDESRQTFAFYHRVGVEEVLIVDPEERTAEWFVRATDAFRPAFGSVLLGMTSAEFAAAIDWPT